MDARSRPQTFGWRALIHSRLHVLTSRIQCVSVVKLRITRTRTELGANAGWAARSSKPWLTTILFPDL